MYVCTLNPLFDSLSGVTIRYSLECVNMDEEVLIDKVQPKPTKLSQTNSFIGRCNQAEKEKAINQGEVMGVVKVAN